MSESVLTIGVHESGLARAQAELLAGRLLAHGLRYPVHLEIVEGAGDRRIGLHEDHIAENRSRMSHLHGLLRDGAIDVVIHRGFDLRGEIPDDLRVAAVLERANPYDVLVAPRELSLDEMDEGDRVGVVQLRVRSQLLGYRPDLEWELVEGDVGAWLTALIDGDIEALVAPGAAIEHLGLQERVCEIFPPELVVPAPGSGVLLCLTRREDEGTCERLRGLHHQPTADEYAAECALMEVLEGRWDHPIGALAQRIGDEMAMIAVVASADGALLVRDNHIASADDPCEVGRQLAAFLMEAGAGRILRRDETLDEAGLLELAGVLASPPPDDADWDSPRERSWTDEPGQDDLLDQALSLEELEDTEEVEEDHGHDVEEERDVSEEADSDEEDDDWP